MRSGLGEISQLTLELFVQMTGEEVRMGPPLLWIVEKSTLPIPQVLQRFRDRRLQFLIAYNLLLKYKTRAVGFVIFKKKKTTTTKNHSGPCEFSPSSPNKPLWPPQPPFHQLWEARLSSWGFHRRQREGGTAVRGGGEGRGTWPYSPS